MGKLFSKHSSLYVNHQSLITRTHRSRNKMSAALEHGHHKRLGKATKTMALVSLEAGVRVLDKRNGHINQGRLGSH